jgi:hypothetical protein
MCFFSSGTRLLQRKNMSLLSSDVHVVIFLPGTMMLYTVAAFSVPWKIYLPVRWLCIHKHTGAERPVI